MGILAAACLSLAVQDRADEFFEGLRFEEARPESERGERVNAMLRKKEHWVAAHRAIEARLGPMREKIAVTVSFDYDGEEVAQAAARGGTGKIRFNLKKLEDYQLKLDNFESQKKELALKGSRLVFKVAPARLDRVIWHELTHIFHADYAAPEWFKEGLAQWLSEDPNTMQAFAYARKDVEGIETPVEEKSDVYARGHLFWSWLAGRGAVRAVVQATVAEGGPWKASIEKTLGLSWTSIETAEREWSAKEIVKIRDRQK
jgi:hypothetical protein